MIILEDGSIDNPLIPQPLSFKSKTSSESNTPLKRSPTIPYVESGARWMERQEAHSLRMALEDMDLQEDERIHIAAQDEASSLVLEHQKSGTLKKPESPYNNPDIPVRDYKAHLRKGSYSRSLSVVPADSEHTRNDSTTRCSITSPEPSKDNEETRSETPSSNTSGHADTETRDATNVETTQKPHKSKSYHGLANAVKRDVASARRRISSGGNRKPSSERGHFMNPADKIWEERQEATMPIVKNHTEVTEKRIKEPESASVKSAEPEMPRHVRRNPFARVRFAQEKLERTNSAQVPTAKRFNPVEVQKNTPTQSRKPWYLSNKPVTPVPTMPVPVEADEETMGEGTRMKDGKEIRSDDIRTATSMKRKDRSPNLPQPTAVSDSPGRPIVSFQPGWKTQEVERNQDPIKPVTRTLTDSSRALPPSPIRHATSIGKLNRTSDGRSTATFNPGPLPSVAVPSEGPTIPFINLPDDDGTPSRVLPEEPPEMPSIFIDCSPTREKAGFDVPPSPPKRVSTKEAPLSRPLLRPLPNPSSKSASPDRPGPHHAATAPLPGTKPHYTPSVRRNTALCAHCALPIAGRILSAAGERFHPECFKCHECGTNLECVAFFPEPDQKHYERIARIQQRNQGLEVQVPNGMTEEDVWRMEVEDGDESLRFFCHLDFHELFSPRCKSCKTPIEGEVVVACGAEWHVGHFFCAQCGDVSCYISSFLVWEYRDADTETAF